MFKKVSFYDKNLAGVLQLKSFRIAGLAKTTKYPSSPLALAREQALG
jgi:hypothetical protein